MAAAGWIGRAALATVFVVPGVALQGRAPDSLSDMLQQTLSALDALAQLEVRVRAGEPGAIEAVQAATEAPLAPELRDDAALLELRGAVASLEAALDQAHAGSSTHVPGHTGVRVDEEFAQQPPAVATTGLSGAELARLSDLHPRGAPAANPAGAAQGGQAQRSNAARSFEAEGYTADSVRLARAYYKQGRWNDALILLEGRDHSAAGTYWRARCLEKLGRDAEALKAYESVVGDPAAGETAELARKDMEFLRWRMDFGARRKAAAEADTK